MRAIALVLAITTGCAASAGGKVAQGAMMGTGLISLGVGGIVEQGFPPSLDGSTMHDADGARPFYIIGAVLITGAVILGLVDRDPPTRVIE